MKEWLNWAYVELFAQKRNLKRLDDRDEHILIVEGHVFLLRRLSMYELRINIFIFFVSEVSFEVLMSSIIVLNLSVA